MIKSGKHCDKRRICTFCAISSLVTKFSKSRLLQRRQKASVWGKGLSDTMIIRLRGNTGTTSYRCFRLICHMRVYSFKPFPKYNKSAADDLENILTKAWKIFLNVSLIIKRSWKHCVKWKKCSSSWAIFTFTTLFSKVVYCRVVRKRLHVENGLSETF